MHCVSRGLAVSQSNTVIAQFTKDWMHCVQIWFAMIACAYIFAQLHQGSLKSGHRIYFAIITFAPQYCTIQGNIVQFNKAKGMRCVQIGHLICFAALAHVFAFLHISPKFMICISYANNHSWPYCLWELAPPPFYLNTMAGGLSYASGRGLCRGQLIPEANYLAWVKIMTLRRPLINPQVRLWVIMTIQQPPHQFTVVNNHTQLPDSIQNQSSRCNNCPHLRGLVINDNDSS